MKRINFDIIIKILAILGVAYFLFVLTIIADNLGNGRYQFKTDTSIILDTKTGKIYHNRDGQLIENK